jgi:hypothetical protein
MRPLNPDRVCEKMTASSQPEPSMPRPLAACPLVVALVVGLAVADNPPAKTVPNKSKSGPVPGYELRDIEGFHVLINKKCLAEAEKAQDEYETPPLEVLENEFKALNQILLPKLLKVLQGVTIWVEWDELPPGVKMSEEEKARGGRVVAVYRYGSPYSAARGFQEGKLSHPGKMNAVEIMTLKRLTEMHQPGKDKDQIILLHELCHTVHHVFLGNGNPEVMNAYRLAMERGLYPKVYARTNDHEYFAEISCAYLDRCNNAPFTADELKDYDETGYKLCEKIWGKQDMIAKARAKAKVERDSRARIRRVTSGRSANGSPAAMSKADPEKAALQKLEFIKQLAKDGQPERTKERLKDLIQTYPGTRAADEAAKMLETP